MIVTRLTDMFGLSVPVVLAPMGGVSGGRLAAAVSNAGGLGLVGGGYGDADWMAREIALVREGTRKAWGVGLITWAVTAATVEQVLASGPSAVMLSFGDPRPFGRLINSAGCRLICQVQDMDGAILAQEAGADLIVAQGTEAGGHGGARATLPLVPAVGDLVAPTPVIAAGGIADGRGLAAALMLGAHGALIGTRFYASNEALGSARAKRRITGSLGLGTTRTRVFDVVRGYDWPEAYTGRALKNRFTGRWHGQEAALRETLPAEKAAYLKAVAGEDCDTAVVWAGEAVDLITHVEDAATLVARLGQDAETWLAHGAQLLR
jgi:nitronate monooxygenase